MKIMRQYYQRRSRTRTRVERHDCVTSVVALLSARVSETRAPLSVRWERSTLRFVQERVVRYVTIEPCARVWLHISEIIILTYSIFMNVARARARSRAHAYIVNNIGCVCACACHVCVQ